MNLNSLPTARASNGHLILGRTDGGSKIINERQVRPEPYA
ncbi:UNVERIFIED_ORG: hypothetical protein GGI63_003807 [Rhizobium esperanzae]